MPIDLHVHSTESDGTFTPEELIDSAISNEIDTIALCDHDTISGVTAFLQYAQGKKVRAIAGVELSAFSDGGECHILGINIPLNNMELNAALEGYRNSRIVRNDGIVKKVNELGISISNQDVCVYSKGEIAGRMHIAKVLVDKGVAGSIDDAFRKFLVQGAPAFVDRLKMDPFEMVELLKRTGANVVLAHPGLLHMDEETLFNFVNKLVESGLDALEVYTPHNTDAQIEMLSKMAESLNLMKSGGSDFHGENKTSHEIGFYRTGVYVPDTVYSILATGNKYIV
jgi:predicted metal-dependent phosphoesterase TrpH